MWQPKLQYEKNFNPKKIVNSKLLGTYLWEIGKVQLLTHDQEVVLAKRVKEWDHEAREKLVNANLRYVVSVAKHYQYLWLSLSDLINEGNIGLMKSIENFDPTLWFRFISYAKKRIKREIYDAIWYYWSIAPKPPQKAHSLDTLQKAHTRESINKTREALTQTLGRFATVEEIIETLELTNEQVAMLMLENQRRYFSLDKPLIEWEPDTLWDNLPSDINNEEDYLTSSYLPKANYNPTIIALKSRIKQYYIDAEVPYNEAEVPYIEENERTNFLSNVIARAFELSELKLIEKIILTLYFWLYWVECCETKEIAKLLWINDRQVIYHKNRAIKKLKKMPEIWYLIEFF